MGILQTVLHKTIGTQNDRELRRIYPIVNRINEIEPQFQALTDTELKAKTVEFQERIARGESTDSLLPEGFAAIREASKRVLGMRHYDVQLVGGITLHKGRIAEMKTGEGKTLVATLPSYLNALTKRGVHVITVNDYLARRDTEWMGQVYRWMGLEVGTILHGLNDRERKAAYAADITYGTNNEFGFDYLRDNMKFRLEDYVQRELHYAIVDEVDSILIDEARTPLIISGPAEASTALYYEIDRKLRQDGFLVNEEDYTVDEKSKTASLTDAGVEKMEKRLNIANLFDPAHIEVLHHVNQALRAHVLFKPDVDYVVRDGSIIIVDEFTGRMMPGRRWSDGLHQAIEAKEGVQIENENQTLATITFQNYFRMYSKLSGMTGTADTEATEFKQIYNLDVSVIPTNRPIQRKDQPDLVYKSEALKFEAIVKQIEECHARNQPVLVGTISIEKSEVISRALKKSGIAHNVLNAKQHEREADIVAQAGKKGTVTIATNMAGRGTDIVLGGNAEALARTEVGAAPGFESSEEERKAYNQKLEEATARWIERSKVEKKEVLDAGGLFILGTERHESRRIDNQLRGRSGRQGDPGESRFYLSLDDDLMRIFGGDRIKRFMDDDMPIEHGMISRAIENAQKKVEGHNYDIRKHLLQYDDVMNQQRKIIYAMRRDVLGAENCKDMLFSMVSELATVISEDFFPNGRLPRVDGQPHLDLDELNDAVEVMFSLRAHIEEKEIEPFNNVGLKKLLERLAEEHYAKKERTFGEKTLREVEKMILLTTIDALWKDHLLAMDHLRDGIGLRGYGQKDPLVEYKKEGFRFFEMMMRQITADSVRKAFAVQVEREADPRMLFSRQPEGLGDIEYNVDADGELVQKFELPSEEQSNPVGGPQLGSPFGEPPHIVSDNPGDPRLAAEAASFLRSGGAPRSSGTGRMVQPVTPTQKVGRNDPCPCGSGKKYKKCHGQGL